MKRIKILIYWEQYSWGGVDAHLLELLSTWPSDRDQFILMVNRGNEGYLRIQKELALLSNVRCVIVDSYSHNELYRRFKKTFFLKYFSIFLVLLQPLIYWYFVKCLKKHFIQAGKFDVLISNNGGYPAAWGSLVALTAAKQIGIPVRFLLIHHAATRPMLFMGWFERILDRIISNTAEFICVSWATRNSLFQNRYFNDETTRIHVIHNSVSVFSQEMKTDLITLKKLKSDSEYLIGIVGRIEPYKGQEDLILALARLKREEQECIQVVIIGRGIDLEIQRLQQVANCLGVGQKVNFLGYLIGKSIEVIQQLDLLVMLTRSFEGFGLTVIEAMHAETPVLVTRVGAIPEFVTQENGVLISPGSPKELANALSNFISYPEKWKARAKVAKQQLEKNNYFMADEYRQLCLESLARCRFT